MPQNYDLVALIEDWSALHKATQQPILLRRGQIGTVMMTFGQEACLVDFADSLGITYAMETIPTDKLLPLIQEPAAIPAK